MASPVVVPCAKNTWVKVITNLTAATIRIISNAPDQYAWTYVATGGAVPTDQSESVPLKNNHPLLFAAAADVYVYAIGKAGEVRIDT